MNVITFDLETPSAAALFTGRHNGPFCRLAGYALNDGPVHTTTDMQELIQALDEADVITGHNVTLFDLIALAHHHGADFPALAAKAFDTLTAARLLDPIWPRLKGDPETFYKAATKAGYNPADILGQSHSLNAVCARYDVPAKTDDIKRLARVHGGFDLIPVDDPEYVSYLVGDIEASRALYAVVRNEITKRGLLPAFERETRLDVIKGRMMLVGFRMDTDTLAEAAKDEADRLDAAWAKLHDLGVPHRREAGTELVPKERKVKPKARTRYRRLFQQEPPATITVYKKRKVKEIRDPLATSDGVQAVISALLAAGVRESDIPRTEKGNPSLSSDTLGSDQWVRGNDRLDGLSLMYSDNPEVLDICARVIDVVSRDRKIGELVEHTVNGRVHARIGQQQASGRWAHVEPSITNLGKHGDKVKERRFFLPEEGHVILAVDLDQVDARAVAAWCQDPGLLAECLPGVDMHAEMGKRLFGGETYATDPKKFRKLAKAPRHSRNYGEGAAKMAAAMGLPLDETQAILSRMDAEYPRWHGWQTEIRETAVRCGYHLDNGWRTIRVLPGMEYTQAPAQIGQSTTRELIVDGLLRMDDELLDCLRVVVHDEVVLSIPADRVEEIAQRVRQCFTTVFRGVGITAGAQQGINWADACDEDNEIKLPDVEPVATFDGLHEVRDVVGGVQEERVFEPPLRHPRLGAYMSWWIGQGVPVRPQSGNKPCGKPIDKASKARYAISEESDRWRWERDLDLVTGYGVVCGPETGILGIDLDVVKNDLGLVIRDGWADWRGLLEEHGVEFDTLTNITPSGGRHLILRVPESWWEWLVSGDDKKRAITVKTGSITGPGTMRGEALYAPDPEVRERLGHSRPVEAPEGLEAVLRAIVGDRKASASYSDTIDEDHIRECYSRIPEALSLPVPRPIQDVFRRTVLAWAVDDLVATYTGTSEGAGLDSAVFSTACRLACYAPHYANPVEVAEALADAAVTARPDGSHEQFLRSAHRGFNKVWGAEGFESRFGLAHWTALDFTDRAGEERSRRAAVRPRAGGVALTVDEDVMAAIEEAQARNEAQAAVEKAPLPAQAPAPVQETAGGSAGGLKVPAGVYRPDRVLRRLIDRSKERLTGAATLRDVTGQAWYLGKSLAPFGVSPKVAIQFVLQYSPVSLGEEERLEVRRAVLDGYQSPMDYAVTQGS